MAQIYLDISKVPEPNARTALDTAGNALQAFAISAKYNTAANTTSFSATPAQVTGSADTVVLALTGALGSGQNITMPTTSTWIAALNGFAQLVGSTFLLRIINESSGAFSWTVVAGDGSTTLTGTATIAQNTWREFIVTFATATTLTMQNAGTGTFS